jgi:methionine-rich copper-binding protein CopC
MRQLIRTLAVGLVAGLALLLGAAPALAHTRLSSSDPADGASLASPPERISLVFNETVQAEFSTITVAGPDGGEWQAGAVEGAGDEVSVALRPLGPAGEYRVGYRVVA